MRRRWAIAHGPRDRPRARCVDIWTVRRLLNGRVAADGGVWALSRRDPRGVFASRKRIYRSGHADWHSDGLRDVSQQLDLPIVLRLRDRLRLPGQRFSGSRIVEVSRHQVDVEVRHRISEQLVVHVARREHLLDDLRDAVNVLPVRRDFRRAQTREVRNVTISKDDDRMATSDGVSLQVGVTHASGVKRLTELVPTKPALRPLFPGVPVLGPCSCHCRCLPRGDPPQCRTAEANCNGPTNDL